MAKLPPDHVEKLNELAGKYPKNPRKVEEEYTKWVAQQAAGGPVDVKRTNKQGGPTGFSFDDQAFEQFKKQVAGDRSRARQKKRRGFVSTILASNDEEGQVRRPSLLS